MQQLCMHPPCERLFATHAKVIRNVSLSIVERQDKSLNVSSCWSKMSATLIKSLGAGWAKILYIQVIRESFVVVVCSQKTAA